MLICIVLYDVTVYLQEGRKRSSFMFLLNYIDFISLMENILSVYKLYINS